MTARHRLFLIPISHCHVFLSWPLADRTRGTPLCLVLYSNVSVCQHLKIFDGDG